MGKKIGTTIIAFSLIALVAVLGVQKVQTINNPEQSSIDSPVSEDGTSLGDMTDEEFEAEMEDLFGSDDTSEDFLNFSQEHMTGEEFEEDRAASIAYQQQQAVDEAVCETKEVNGVMGEYTHMEYISGSNWSVTDETTWPGASTPQTSPNSNMATGICTYG